MNKEQIENFFKTLKIGDITRYANKTFDFGLEIVLREPNFFDDGSVAVYVFSLKDKKIFEYDVVFGDDPYLTLTKIYDT